MSDTPTGETVVTQAPSNDTSAPAPVQGNAGQADVEAAKREAEQARLRANQLENELKKLRDAEEAARQKQLEEKEEYKTLYEQEANRRRELEEAQSAAERSQLLTSETQAVFAEYPEAVVELAKTAGLSLTDDSDAAKATLKEKLDTFASKVAPQGKKVAANNPSSPSSAVSQEDIQAAMREARKKGHSVDPKVTSQFIQNMPAFQKFKEIGQRGY